MTIEQWILYVMYLAASLAVLMGNVGRYVTLDHYAPERVLLTLHQQYLDCQQYIVSIFSSQI